ncbi:hypothetical protein LMG26858_04395 [Achromobacter anxifer]|uniref:Uncharacterized protein n=1 Tax=Achromobacter anxifer TaxID=1287737 RepID=A0A6S7EAV3_9BURK|nr:hypothetical protein [Achromobacter anxifer]CAB3904244.1 hypothetical protein LMG26858_04395 [Achromobacter anxifer]
MRPPTSAALAAAASIASSATGYATAHTDHSLGTPFFIAFLLALVFATLAAAAADKD